MLHTIVITSPDAVVGEAAAIERMLAGGLVDRVHIRKPSWSREQVSGLLGGIPAELYRRLSLHDHFPLALEMGIGGVHLNGRNPSVPEGFRGIVSRSCHSFDELETLDSSISYATLSPVFDSISKPGYQARFTPEEIARRLPGVPLPVFALGGVTPEKLHLLAEQGFAGGAVLGAAWRDVDGFLNALHIERSFPLQFITHGKNAGEIADQTRRALEGGCRWVQLRMKGASRAEIMEAGTQVGALCRRDGAVFLIDDHAELVEPLGADGVHLGKNDMPLREAAAILGSGKIIGATANTAEDILRAASEGATYVGLGPMRFTETKQNLSPILGLEGYSRIMRQVRTQGVELPVVAIGGITPAVCPALLEAGVDGVAVSGAIISAPSPAAATANFLRALTRRYQYSAAHRFGSES